jgi:hypothetical protein
VTDLTVVYDASVLYPAPLRDFLMWLGLTDLYKARWTNEIHDEWMRNVLKNRPDLTLQQLTRTKELMNSCVRDCLVEGYQSLIPSLQLPDLGDRHVLATAIYCNAKIIVTFNLKDFPAEALKQYGIEAQHPDEFVSYLLSINCDRVCEAARRQRNTLKNPPKTTLEYLETLDKQGLTRTTAKLRELIEQL